MPTLQETESRVTHVLSRSHSDPCCPVRDLPCATGVIDLKTFLGALVKIGYDGPVRAEPFKAELRKMPREQAVEATAKVIRKAMRHEPTIDWLLENQDKVQHYYHQQGIEGNL